MNSIDLNCDLGEGAPHDHALLRLVTSASIACGGHAGDSGTMRSCVAGALAAGVSIGAHPGYEDRVGFGRLELGLSPEKITELVIAQVETLRDIARELGGRVTHVKPHGALYHRATQDAFAASAVAKAVAACGADLVVFAPPHGELGPAARRAGLRVVREGFVDRTYGDDGRLTPRTAKHALVTSAREAAAQGVSIATHGCARTPEGAWVPIEAETLCLHGDGPKALEFARALHAALRGAAVPVRSYLAGTSTEP